MKPAKPRPDFPMFPAGNGQWAKKINGKPYYFGSWREDAAGDAAVRELADRLPGILAGTDHLRALAASGDGSVGDLCKRFLSQRRLDVQAGSLARITYGQYITECDLFVTWIKGATPVAALKPEHFASYAASLIEVRKLKARSRKRSQAYVKTMFRWGPNAGFVVPEFGSAFKAPSTTQEAVRKEKARMGQIDRSDRIVTGVEVDRLIEASQPNMKAIILLGINCGLGPADIGRLKWQHLDLTRRRLAYPRHKTGNARIGYLWKRTVEAIEAVRKLKHTAKAFAAEKQDALVFVTRKGQAYYREWELTENGKVTGIQVANAISITFGRLTVKLEIVGVTFYRLRHTFKTLGKRARDRDALNLCMGHKTNSVEEGYDHEDIPFKRIKRVALAVKKRLWPTPRRQAGVTDQPTLRLVGDGDEPAESAAA